MLRIVLMDAMNELSQHKEIPLKRVARVERQWHSNSRENLEMPHGITLLDFDVRNVLTYIYFWFQCVIILQTFS